MARFGRLVASVARLAQALPGERSSIAVRPNRSLGRDVRAHHHGREDHRYCQCERDDGDEQHGVVLLPRDAGNDGTLGALWVIGYLYGLTYRGNQQLQGRRRRNRAASRQQLSMAEFVHRPRLPSRDPAASSKKPCEIPTSPRECPQFVPLRCCRWFDGAVGCAGEGRCRVHGDGWGGDARYGRRGRGAAVLAVAHRWRDVLQTHWVESQHRLGRLDGRGSWVCFDLDDPPRGTVHGSVRGHTARRGSCAGTVGARSAPRRAGAPRRRSRVRRAPGHRRGDVLNPAKDHRA